MAHGILSGSSALGSFTVDSSIGEKSVSTWLMNSLHINRSWYLGLKHEGVNYLLILSQPIVCSYLVHVSSNHWLSLLLLLSINT